MVTREVFRSLPQYSGPRFVPIEQVFDICILRCDPLGFSEPQIVRFEIAHQPELAEAMVHDCTEEWRCPWVLRSKIILES